MEQILNETDFEWNIFQMETIFVFEILFYLKFVPFKICSKLKTV
jgi:hypothetical protein